MSQAFINQIKQFVSEKIPMIAYTDMDILHVDETSCLIKIPFSTKTKNHLNSMYFGALSVGADCAGGLLALFHTMQLKQNMPIAFKDFSASFLKRPESDVYFACQDGALIKEKVLTALESQERVSFPVTVEAYTQVQHEKIPVAQFTLTLSMKLAKN